MTRQAADQGWRGAAEDTEAAPADSRLRSSSVIDVHIAFHLRNSVGTPGYESLPCRSTKLSQLTLARMNVWPISPVAILALRHAARTGA